MRSLSWTPLSSDMALLSLLVQQGLCFHSLSGTGSAPDEELLQGVLVSSAEERTQAPRPGFAHGSWGLRAPRLFLGTG